MFFFQNIRKTSIKAQKFIEERAPEIIFSKSGHIWRYYVNIEEVLESGSRHGHSPSPGRKRLRACLQGGGGPQVVEITRLPVVKNKPASTCNLEDSASLHHPRVTFSMVSFVKFSSSEVSKFLR